MDIEAPLHNTRDIPFGMSRHEIHLKISKHNIIRRTAKKVSFSYNFYAFSLFFP